MNEYPTIPAPEHTQGVYKWTMDALFNKSSPSKKYSQNRPSTAPNFDLLDEPTDLRRMNLRFPVSNETTEFLDSLHRKRVPDAYDRVSDRYYKNVSERVTHDVPSAFPAGEYQDLLKEVDSNNSRLEKLYEQIHAHAGDLQYKQKYMELRQELIDELKNSKELYDNYYALHEKYKALQRNDGSRVAALEAERDQLQRECLALRKERDMLALERDQLRGHSDPCGSNKPLGTFSDRDYNNGVAYDRDGARVYGDIHMPLSEGPRERERYDNYYSRRQMENDKRLNDIING